MISTILSQLEENGIAIVPGLVAPEALRAMQASFESRLKRMRWNDFDGYEKTEPYRHTVPDILALDQAFLDLGVHPLIKSVLQEYLGEAFALVEAKGWKSLPTNRDFHGWHGDAWYDQSLIRDHIPREVKLGFYLTEVNTGGFIYLKGSHRKRRPALLKREEARQLPPDRFVEVTGTAGLAFLFDTSGIHRQNIPILEPRQAVFYCYHDPGVPLQGEDLAYYRYHPLLLNAAFLGNLSTEDQRILGFGYSGNFQAAYQRQPRHRFFQELIRVSYDAQVHLSDLCGRVEGKLTRARISRLNPFWSRMSLKQ